MRKYDKKFKTDDYRIEDVLKWIEGHMPVGIGSSVTPVKERGINYWKVEWYDND